MNNYVVIYDNGDMIQCRGVYPYHEAVGRLVCLMTDSIEGLKSDGYEITKREDFETLEADTGYGWFIEMLDKKHDITVKENWYLLLVENEE